MITSRILKIIELKGINKSRFYKETGLSNGFLDKVKDIGSSKIENILNCYPEINPAWLITGKGSMILENPTQKEVISANGPDDGIPLLGVSAIAGFGNVNFAIEEKDVKDYYVIPKFKHKKIDFMIEVEGASMYPKYNSGDVVACTVVKESNFIQWHKVHVVATKEQGILIKRIETSDQSDCLKMISDNKKYSPFDVPNDEITGIALVVGVIRLE